MIIDIVFLEYNAMLKVKKNATHPIFLYNRANWEQMRDMRELHFDYSELGDTTAEDLW